VALIQAAGWLPIPRPFVDGNGGQDVYTLESAELPPEQRAFLLRTCGAVGRDASTLQEVLQAATDTEDLLQRLRAENLDILRESDPTARVYAFEWLRARGAAPDGFDPLGDATARRHALDRHAQDRAAKAAPAPPGNGR